MYAVRWRDEMVRCTLARGKLDVCGHVLLGVVHGGIEALLRHLLSKLALVLEIGSVML